MAWTVSLTRSANRDLDDLADDLMREALSFLQSFEDDPFPPDSLPLRGFRDTHRVRLGGYRIIYQANPQKHAVLVTRIRLRSVVYKGFEGLGRPQDL